MMLKTLENMNDKSIIWQPQAGGQVDVLSCPIFEVLIEGNRGSGKSDVLLADFLQHVGRGYKSAWRGIVFRETYPNLEEIVNKSKKLIPQIFPGAKWSGDYLWKFPEGEILYFRHARRKEDYWNYHGWEIPWLGWEELTNWLSLDVYIMMMSICRSSHKDVPRKIRANCNPWGKSHNQVKKRFKIGQIKSKTVIEEKTYIKELNKTIHRDRCYIHLPRIENKLFTEADPAYILSIKQQTNPEIKKAWDEGSWDIVAGGMWDDLWDSELHVLPRLELPQSWYYDRSFDYGSSHPFSIGWWARSDGTPVTIEYNLNNTIIREQRTFPPGTLIRFWEYYGCDPNMDNTGLRLSSREIGRIIAEQEDQIKRIFKIKKINPGPADSSIFDSDHKHESIAQEINIGYGNSKSRDIFVKSDKAPGTRAKRWQLIRDRLHASLQFPMEDPGLFVTEDCQDFLRVFPITQRDEKKLDDIPTDSEDHIQDEVGYRMLHHPNIGKSLYAKIG